MRLNYKYIACPACGGRAAAEGLQRRNPLRGQMFEMASLDAIEAVEGEELMLAHAKRYAAAPCGWFCVEGPAGNAKTYTLAAMRNTMRANGLGVYYVTGPDLSAFLFRCLSEHDDYIDLERLVRCLRDVDVLMVDEADKVKWKTDFVFEQVFRILGDRYENNGLPTCVAFNEREAIPDVVLSRFNDGRWAPAGHAGGIIPNVGKDQRPYLPSLWEREGV